MSGSTGSSDAEERRWTGRSGRRYRRDDAESPRDGGMAAVLRVVAEGDGPAGSPVDGAYLALKLARAEEPLAMEALAREAEILDLLSRSPGAPPSPRLQDVVGDPPRGLVMEWCPTDLERWWAVHRDDPGAFAELCEAMADVCRRVREYAAVAEIELDRTVIHADVKPRNVLRAEDGRWLLTDFGAAKSRPVELAEWDATRMIIGTENFIAPEALFNAVKPYPAAMDTWSIACSFFALLRMRPLLRGGGRMPPNGTHSHYFRTQRVALVTDLQQRKPALFAGRDLDASAFASPDRLPDKDRAAVDEAIAGVLGPPTPATAALEAKLGAEVCNLLDRALMIDPAARYLDALEMAAEFEALATRWRELVRRAQVAGASGPTGQVSSVPAVAPPAQRARAEGPLQEVQVPDEILERHAERGWSTAAVAVLYVLQVVQIVVGASALWLSWHAFDAVSPGGASARVRSLWVPVSTPAPPPPAELPLARAIGGPAPQPPPEPLAAAVVPEPPPAEAVEGAEPDEPAEEPAAAPTPPAPQRGHSRTVVRREARKEAISPVAAAEAAPPAPAATPPPAGADVPADADGVLLVAGAQAYLVGDQGRVPPGSVSPGTYQVWVESGGNFVQAGVFTVAAGERLAVRCGFGTCRATR